MDNKRPQLYLLLALAVSAATFGLVCFLCKQFNLTADQRNTFTLVSIIGYLATTGCLILASRSLSAGQIADDNARANLLSCLTNTAGIDDEKLIRIPLEAIATALAKEFEELKQAQRAIVDYSPEIVASLNQKYEILELNANAERIWQHPNFSLLGASILQIAYEGDRQLLEQYLQECKTGKEQKPLECRFLTPNKRLIDLSLNAEWSSSGQGYYCVANDISAQKEIERLKAEISQMVSHDLRAPVSSLSFFLEGLLGGDFGTLTESGKSQVLKLKDSLEQVLRLINQLLDAEKLEAGGINVDLKVVPVSSILETSINILTPLAQKKRLTIDCAETEALAFADFDRTVQVFSNLLSNAIKWSPEPGAIKVTVTGDKETVKVEVSDQGPGIPVNQWTVIFERFKTLDSSNAASGAGLGLYISKKIIELQSGQMGVYSVPGKGASFWFSLKRAGEEDLPGYLD